MVFEHTGNMFQMAPMGALVGIPVNTVGVAGKGLALHMKQRYPEAHEQYKQACRRGRIAGGELLVVDVIAYKLAMLPTKYNWVNPSEPGLIDQTLYRLVEYMRANSIEEAHIPRLGCGVATGMLDYEEDVSPIIQFHFGSDEQKEAIHVYNFV